MAFDSGAGRQPNKVRKNPPDRHRNRPSAEVDRLIRDLWNSALPGDEGPGLSPEQAAHAYGGEGQPHPQARDRSRVMSSEVSHHRPSPEELALLTLAQEGARGQPAHAERTGGPGWTNPTLQHEAFENEIMRLVMSDERWKEAYEKYPERIPTVAWYAANAQMRELLEGKPRIGEEPRQQQPPQSSPRARPPSTLSRTKSIVQKAPPTMRR